jgi:hypothetical protein
MTSGARVSPSIETLADLHERLGRVPLYRIRCHPAPGTATEADVLVYPRDVGRWHGITGIPVDDSGMVCTSRTTP